MKLNEESFAPADDETEGGSAGWAALLLLLLAGACAFLLFAGMAAG